MEYQFPTDQDKEDEESVFTKLARVAAENAHQKEQLNQAHSNIFRDKVQMALNPNLQGPRQPEEGLPVEKDYYNQLVSDVGGGVGSLTSGSSRAVMNKLYSKPDISTKFRDMAKASKVDVNAPGVFPKMIDKYQEIMRSETMPKEIKDDAYEAIKILLKRYGK